MIKSDRLRVSVGGRAPPAVGAPMEGPWGWASEARPPPVLFLFMLAHSPFPAPAGLVRIPHLEA